MTSEPGALMWRVQRMIQTFAVSLLVGLAVVLLVASLLAVLGLVPWLQLYAGFNEPVVGAGIVAQVGMAVLAVSLCFFLPTNARVLRLENAHRDFSISMEDIAKAYTLSHRADREGIFALSSEFDSVRERMTQLRQHPDLALLEPELLEVAAQMSFEARDLARIYSDERVARAKGFLVQRQQELVAYRDRLALAQYACTELKRWLGDIEADEKVAASQLERLERDLREILPKLGYDFEEPQANVVPISKPAK